MANQFNNQKCSKCNSKYAGAYDKNIIGYGSHCGHEHFFKKNGQLFCINCLMAEGHVSCQNCGRLFRNYDKVGKWVKKTVPRGDHTAEAVIDTSDFACECREHKSGVRAIQCQGIVSSQYGGKVQCNEMVSVDDEGGFCQNHKNQTAETHQQWKGELKILGNGIRENFRQALQHGQSWWDSLSNEERQKEIRSLEARLPARLKELWNSRGFTWDSNKNKHVVGNAADGLSNLDRFENGKYYQDDPTKVPWVIVDEFADKLASGVLKLEDKTNNDNNNSLSVNNSNSPAQLPQSEDSNKEGNFSESEEKITENGEKSLESENGGKEIENKSDKIDNFIINFKEVKKITLRSDGKLEIEFNRAQNGDSWYSISQIITDEQINNNQELQAVKNYCQQNGKDSLGQEELNSILNSNSTNQGSVSKPSDNNHALTIGLSITAALIVGLAIGLLLKRKKKVKRS